MDNPEVIQTIAFSTLAILLMVVAVINVNISMNKQAMKQQLKEQDLALNYQKELRNVESEIGDAIMQDLSSELHDNVQHTLTLLRFQLESLFMEQPGQEDQKEAIQETLFNANSQLRSLAHRLNSDFIMENDINSLIELEVERLRQIKALAVHWSTDNGIADLDKDRLLLSFRIFQEMLNNTLKHSKAKNIFISLKTDPVFCIETSDDGVGFDITAQKESGRWNGLRSVEKRASMAGMSFIIESVPGEGTRYILEDTTAGQIG